VPKTDVFGTLFASLMFLPQEDWTLGSRWTGIRGKLPGHICDHDLERYHLGMVKDEAELAALEEPAMVRRLR
jgi:hypothetical protein